MSQASITLELQHDDDIRRLQVDQLELEVIQKLLTPLYPHPHSLKYDDDEGDRITIVTQSDLDDALLASKQDGVIKLYVVDKETTDAKTSTSTAAASATATTPTASGDNTSQLSRDEITTLLTQCMSDMTLLTATPTFLMSFINTLINNINTTTPMTTAWNTAVAANPIIRDHVILSALLPRAQDAITRADGSGFATRIPIQTLEMIKNFIPMLPMFLPSLIPMLTQMMSSGNVPSMSDLTSGNNTAMANNPLMAMLGPMLSQFGQQVPATASSTNNSNTNTNNTGAASASATPDYTSQLATLTDLGLGSPELNQSLLVRYDGDVEKVIDMLTNMQ